MVAIHTLLLFFPLPMPFFNYPFNLIITYYPHDFPDLRATTESFFRSLRKKHMIYQKSLTLTKHLNEKHHMLLITPTNRHEKASLSFIS